jgi:hypothetical protein
MSMTLAPWLQCPDYTASNWRQDVVVRLYTPQAVAVGTLLGSLAAGAVLLWLNYRALGYHALANKVAAGGVLLYLLIIGGAALMPDHAILGLLLIAIQTGLAYWSTWILQGDAIAYHQAQGGAVHSLLRAAGVGLLAGLVVWAVALVLMTLVGMPVAPVR